jgi:hypothetical protein
MTSTSTERLTPIPDDDALTRRARRLNRLRRISGMTIGLLMGMVYILVKDLINTLILPGLPIYIPPPGLF